MKLFSKLKKLKESRSGATAIEYALIAGIVGLAVIGGAMSVGTSANGAFTTVKTKVWGS